MRIDITGTAGARAAAVQAHVSFRRCVGQSAAEFVIELLMRRAEGAAAGWRPGVYLPEGLLADPAERARPLRRMTTTPGTFTWRVEVLAEDGAVPAATSTSA